MREAHAHDAVLEMSVDADLAAPGGAVTLALCGSWEHPPPCPLAPHHTSVERIDGAVAVRVLFATEPANVSTVRDRIEQALARQHVEGPDGVVTFWRLMSSGPGTTGAEESERAERLVHG